jgi:hypothetical protein
MLALGIFVALIAVQLIPTLICLFQKRIHFIAPIFLGAFAIFSASRLRNLLVYSGVVLPKRELAYLLFCHLLVLIGYYMAKRILRVPSLKRGELSSIKLDVWQVILTSAVVIGATLMGNRFPDLTQVFDTLQTLGLALLVFSHSRAKGIVTLVLIANVTISFLVTASLCFAVSFAGFWMVAWVIRPSWQGMAKIAILIIAMGAIQTIKADFRRTLIANPAYSLSARAHLVADLLTSRFFRNPSGLNSIGVSNKMGEGIRQSMDAGANRLGDDSLARVVQLSPRVVPFWNGKTYEAIAYAFIPRLLWSHKPTRTVWHDFGMTYQYLAASDPFTSVTFNVFAEGYLNFGNPGMILSAFLLGVLALLAELGSRSIQNKPTTFAFAAFVLPIALFTDTTSLLSVLGYQAILIFAIRGCPYFGKAAEIAIERESLSPEVPRPIQQIPES